MALDLIKFVRNVEQSSLQSLYKKYSSPRFLEAAKLLQQWVVVIYAYSFYVLF